MLFADLCGGAGQGDVQRFRFQAGRGFKGFQLFCFFRELCFEKRAHLIGELPHNRALLGRKLSHLLENSGELALFSQNGYANLFEDSAVLRRFNALFCRLPNGFQLFFHNDLQ